MRCGTCGPRCGGGGCHDHSSTADQKPSLGAIDIVDGIFRQAGRNLARRMVALRTGEMTPEEYDAANDKLVNWLGATFAGRSRHFEIIDHWHPEGLAEEILRVLTGRLSADALDTDEGIIREAGRVYVREAEEILGDALDMGWPASGAAESEPAVILAGRWANLFAGALSE